MTIQTQRNRLTEFFASEYKRMVGFVRKKVDDLAAQDAEDFVQEVAANLFSRADISAPVENLSAYVYRSLRNEIVDYFRLKRNTVSLDAPVNRTEEICFADILKEAGGSSDIQRKETIEELYEHLNRLSQEERALVIATEIEGRTFKELSSRWKIPINTLLSKKSRAMKKLLGEVKKNKHKSMEY